MNSIWIYSISSLLLISQCSAYGYAWNSNKLSGATDSDWTVNDWYNWLLSNYYYQDNDLYDELFEERQHGDVKKAAKTHSPYMIRNGILSIKEKILAGYKTGFGGQKIGCPDNTKVCWGHDNDPQYIEYICCDLHDTCNLNENDEPICDDKFFKFISKIGGGGLPNDMIRKIVGYVDKHWIIPDIDKKK